ncbi:hypothetical protein JCM19992_30500 [Thermostilla marina]
MLKAKHEATVVTYGNLPDEALPQLRRLMPRYTCFVAPPEEAGRQYVARVHHATRQYDDDPYIDTFWGILTGYDAENAVAIARESRPLTIERVAAGTAFAMECVVEGQWYSESEQNKHVVKERGKEPEQRHGPDDPTAALVRVLNEYRPQMFITSGHATERDWQIGYAYRAGQFRCRDGRLFGIDLQGNTYPIDSPNPKVYLPVGNCLMGHVDSRDAMALAWMNSGGVRQMIGYTVPTWYGFMGWGVLDYFVKQPGRYTLVESFTANHHALTWRLENESLSSRDRQGLMYDRDTVALYGDPAWEARLAPGKCPYSLEVDTIATGGEIRCTIEAVAATKIAPGTRPIVVFLPQRIRDPKIIVTPRQASVILDDTVLIPLTEGLNEGDRIKLVFTASVL